MSNVTLLAYTTLTREAFDVLPKDSADGWGAEEADYLAELAGRECYQSFDRPNPATRDNADYLANVIRQNHTSVLAHASFTFRFTGVSRSLTHELIRSRFLAYSELSQRYVDMSNSHTVVPPLFRDDDLASEYILRAEDAAKDVYDLLVERAVSQGATRKQARQAARCVMLGGAETKIVVSGNVRAWRDFIAQRNTEHADDEIREVAGKVLAKIQEFAPNSVADLVADEDQGLTFHEVFDNEPLPGQQLELENA